MTPRHAQTCQRKVMDVIMPFRRLLVVGGVSSRVLSLFDRCGYYLPSVLCSGACRLVLIRVC